MMRDVAPSPIAANVCSCGTPIPESRKYCRDADCKRQRDRERQGIRVPANCLNCGKEFMALKSAVERKGMGKYCSTSCCGAHARATEKLSGANNPSWLGGVSSDNMRYRRRQIERHPVQEAARRAVREAVRAGTLTRQPCEKCGATEAQAHHDDYLKPLDVRWLCRKHHDEVHRELRQAPVSASNENHRPSSDPPEGVPEVSRGSGGSCVTSGGAKEIRTLDGGFADKCPG